MTFSGATSHVPYLTTEQMVEVDRAMIEDSRIELIQMMENAGRNLAHLARRRFLNGEPVGQRVVVLAGTGGNGGGALVAARRLHNWGVDIHVFITRTPDRFTLIPRHQLNILKRMRVPVATADRITDEQVPTLVVDGVIGYNLTGAPTGAAARLIEWANAQEAPVLALDAPSGIDTTTGTVYEPAVRADATMTLALPKEDLRAPGVAPHVGELYLADISVPPSLYAKPPLGLSVGPLFARHDIIRLA